MPFSNRISAAAWATTFRLIRVGLDAGFGLPKVVRQQGERGPLAVRPLMSRVADRLDTGDSMADALAPEAHRLPPLVVAALTVGEESGHMVEALRELEEYYELQKTLKRNFISQIFLPALQIVGVIVILTLLLLVLGWLRIPMDPLGLGTGFPAVLKLWTIIAVGALAIGLAYRGIANRVRFLAPVERITLGIPGLGGALQDVLLGRFSMALKMTLGAGMGVNKALRYSFDAAASSLYQNGFERARHGIRKGESIHEVLQAARVFPDDFLDVVMNAEQGGQLPEVMGRVAKNYQEDAARKLKVVTQFAAVMVYVTVAVVIIILIFKIYGTAMGARNEMIEKNLPR